MDAYSAQFGALALYVVLAVSANVLVWSPALKRYPPRAEFALRHLLPLMVAALLLAVVAAGTDFSQWALRPDEALCGLRGLVATNAEARLYLMIAALLGTVVLLGANTLPFKDRRVRTTLVIGADFLALLPLAGEAARVWLNC